jgi:hypothetical protein
MMRMMEDRNAPALRCDLRHDLAASFDQLRFEVRREFADVKVTLLDVQNELLKAFYGYAHRIDTRLTEREMNRLILCQRLTDMESRITEIEKRLNMPPAA